jgi:hypothetical protein
MYCNLILSPQLNVTSELIAVKRYQFNVIAVVSASRTSFPRGRVSPEHTITVSDISQIHGTEQICIKM